MKPSFFSNRNNLIYTIVGAVVIIALIAAYAWYRYSTDENRTISSTKETVLAEEFALSFSYPVGENALTLIEPPVEGQPFKKAYLLIPNNEYEAFRQNTETGEAPAAISVFIFDLPPAASSTPPTEVNGTTTDRSSRMVRLEEWAKSNSALTSYNLAKSAPEIVEIDGLKAYHYRADGLYQQEVYIGSYQGNVYLFIAQFNAETDQTFTAFQELIASISFD